MHIEQSEILEAIFVFENQIKIEDRTMKIASKRMKMKIYLYLL